MSQPFLTMVSNFFPVILTATILTMLLMFGFWILQVRRKNAGVVDLGWALCLLLLSGMYSLILPGYGLRKCLIFLMVALWAMRLSSLLINRLWKDQKEDNRYQKLREEWKTGVNLKFFFLFQFEAWLALVLSVPFFLIALNEKPQLEPIEIVGIVIWITGFFGESLADAQLEEFKSHPENKGKTCQAGLWNYSRHPNYFFEWSMWVGYFVFALSAGTFGWIAILSPMIMFYFLIKVTGAPLAEAQALRTRGEEYKRYQQTTSFFVPLPKKKIS